MTFDEMVRSRRSIRQYKNTPVREEDLMAVLKAGRLAPSANNAQRWRFTAVTDKALLNQLAPACRNQQMVAEAPVAIVVWAEGDRTMACGQSAATVDCSIALSFMILKATELGLGTCWLGAFDAGAVRSLLQLPQGAILVGITPLGYADETPAARPREKFEDIVTII